MIVADFRYILKGKVVLCSRGKSAWILEQGIYGNFPWNFTLLQLIDFQRLVKP